MLEHCAEILKKICTSCYRCPIHARRSVNAVNVNKTKRQVKLQEWVLQVRACKQSGLPVRQWCNENGVAVKSYYYHLKRVREELLDVMQAKNTIQMEVLC